MDVLQTCCLMMLSTQCGSCGIQNNIVTIQCALSFGYARSIWLRWSVHSTDFIVNIAFEFADLQKLSWGKSQASLGNYVLRDGTKAGH